jgi:branched-chain amino acid transport system permease protein
MIGAILINSLVSGGIYAILAIGFSLIFGVAKILNMAHTAFYMVTGFLLYIAVERIGVPPLPSYILVILSTGILAMICYKSFFDRVKTQESAVMIISIALAMLFQEIFLLKFGAQHRQIQPFVAGFIEITGVIRVTYQHLFTIGTFVVVMYGIWILLSRTKLGKVIRAVSEDSEIANLMGINVSKVSLITIGISGVLAGVAGVVVVPLFTLHPLMWVHPLIIVLASVVLGGLGSVKGSVIGAFILAFAETIVAILIPMGSFLGGAVSLSIMIVMLLIRPEGLFGVVFEEERL